MTDFILSDLGYVDIVLIVFFLIGLFSGFVRGFSVQMTKLISLLLGVSFGLMLFEPMTARLSEQTLISLQVVASVILFVSAIVTSFIFKVIFTVIEKVVSFQFVYFIERVIGSLVGGIRLLFYFCFLSYIVLLWPTNFFAPHFGESSYLGEYVREVIPEYKKATDWFRDRYLSKYLHTEYQVTLAREQSQQEETSEEE